MYQFFVVEISTKRKALQKERDEKHQRLTSLLKEVEDLQSHLEISINWDSDMAMQESSKRLEMNEHKRKLQACILALDEIQAV